jgi:glycolate oxidase FAD binding subunit
MSKDLSKIVGPRGIYDTPSRTTPYSVDGVAPELVLFPGDTEETCELLTQAREAKKSITPWGNGTKMGWGNIPSRMDWVVCTKRLNRVTDPDFENLTVAVEAGTLVSKVQELLRGLAGGYFIPLDPSFSQTATMGGAVATNSSGPKRYLYGTARDLILGMKVILANGEQNVWGGKTVKNVAGYDMNKLYIGSFGTLGIITEVTFRILPLPERETTLIAVFKEASAAFNAVSGILQSEILPSAVEIINSKGIETLGLPFSREDRDTLLAVNFEGFDESVERQTKQAKKMLGAFQALAIDLWEGPNQERFWTGVRDLESIVTFSSPDATSCKINLPVSETGGAFNLLKEATDRIGVDAVLRCHGGSGIVYGDILLKDITHRTGELVKALTEVRQKIRDLAGDLVITRAPVSLKREIDVWGIPRKDFHLMLALKDRFDPHRLLNPGRFVGGI